MHLEKPLQIRDASAGSGKTYSLVQHYLKLLLQENDDRAELGQIMAMTFTNKAALEMKTRIMEDLGKLSGNEVKYKKFLEETAQFIGITPEKTQKNSRLVLRKLLHQYEEFNVMTIDKFNLRLIRTFSRDLDLPENFEILIQKQELLERCLSELLLQVNAKEKSELQRLALNFGKEKLIEEGSWNIKNELQGKINYILNEKELDLIDSLIAYEQGTETEAKIREKYKHLLVNYHEKAKAIALAYTNTGYDNSELAGKSKLERAILKFSNVEEISLSEGLLDLTPAAKKNLEATAEKIDFSTVVAAYNQFSAWISEFGIELAELHLIQKQFTTTNLLREFAVYVSDLRKREATILVSEFNQLVSNLVKNEEAPFIYERLGSKFKHFFLDEFQDTSYLQWQNLVPLVHESIAHNFFNFIVGDPKQSIYRFKNGIAEQFIELPGIYNPEAIANIEEKSNYFKSRGSKLPLEDNWRSAKEIVNFNNAFFSKLKELLPETGKRYFDSVIQHPKGKEGGYVRIEMVKTSKSFQTEDEDPIEENYSSHQSKCLDFVRDAINDGYKPGDICILAYKSKACLEMATALKQEGFQVVSADSLSVNSEATVRMLVHYLGWRLRPTDFKKAALFANSFFEYKFGSKGFEYYIECITRSDEEFFSYSLFYQITGKDENEWLSPFTSIYSCLENVIELMEIDKTQNVYVKQFMDLCFDYDKRNGPNLHDFLTFYKDKGKRTNVQIPENDQAIKIMTAHKSKGLEFPVVILPVLDNDSGNTSNMLVKNADYFFETSVSEKTLSRGIQTSAIKKELEDELMDAVNLLYVEFTRPVDRLYIYNEYSEPKEDKSNEKYVIPFQYAVKHVLQSFENTTITEEGFSLEWGSKPELSSHKTQPSNYYHVDTLEGKLWFPEISMRERSDLEKLGHTEQIRIGRQFHLLMEKSSSLSEAMEHLEELIILGTCEFQHKEVLIEMLKNFFNHELTQTILSGQNSLNERTLIVDETKRLRPDKLVTANDKTIIIDFKTGEELPKHHKQVQEYAAVLKQMNIKEIEGYLYYSSTSSYTKVAL